MPTDWNDRDSIKQFMIESHNQGIPDDAVDAYIAKRKASMAGKTLQAHGAGRSFDKEKGLDNMLNIIPHPPQNVVNALPYALGAPGQAMKEGIDYLQAEKPEDRPTWYGAAARVGGMAVAPAVVGGVTRALGKSVGMAGPAMTRVMNSGPMQAAKILNPFAKEVPAEAEQLGTTIATKTGQALKTMQPSAEAKDAFVAGLNKAGGAINVEKLAEKFMGAVDETAQFGSDTAKQAATRLQQLGDELLSKRVEGKIGIGDFVAFKENIKQQLFNSSNGILRQKLGQLAADADNHIVQEMGPAVGNHIKALEAATSNRLKVLRNVNRFFRTSPEAAIKRAASNDTIMRMLHELGAQTGIDYADEVATLAAKKSLNAVEKSRGVELMTRLTGSGILAAYQGGPAALMAFMATSPGARRTAAKLGMLLATTSIPQLGAAAIANQFSGPSEPPNE